MPQTNVAIDMATLGDGIYSEEQKKSYERFLASGGNSRQLLTDLGESAMEGSKPSFNIFSLMNINALSDMQLTVAARIFGWFSKVDSWLYPAITAYSLWSMLVMVVKIAMAEIKIFREEGFALKKMLAALVSARTRQARCVGLLGRRPRSALAVLQCVKCERGDGGVGGGAVRRGGADGWRCRRRDVE